AGPAPFCVRAAHASCDRAASKLLTFTGIQMQQCPSCNAQFPDDLAQCPSCGEAVSDEPVYVCERCGEQYSGGDSCPTCGTLRETVMCHLHPDREARYRCVVCGRALCEACRASEGRAALCADHAEVRAI